jgi:hypothetical protein
MRVIPEQHVRTVPYTVKRLVPETGTRVVPQVAYEEYPVTRVVDVPRQVPRNVTYCVTRYVPRTQCFEVPVRVYDPVDPKGGGKSVWQQGSGAKDALPPTESADPLIPPDPTLDTPEVALRPVSLTQEPQIERSPAESFSVGQTLYWAGRFHEAAREFTAATVAEPGDAKYLYFTALAQAKAGRSIAAGQTLALAIEVERSAPLGNWGQIMGRVQGPERLWLEAARSRLRQQSR